MVIPTDLKDNKSDEVVNVGAKIDSVQTIFNPNDSDNKQPYKDIINELSSTSEAEHQTTDSFNDIATNGFFDIHKESLNKDIIFNNLLQHYSDSFNSKQEQKTKLKSKYFYWIMILLSLVTLGCFAFPIVTISLSANNQITIIATIFASLIEFSVAFLKLPKIVAEYLFNKGEDEAMTKIISDMQEYNLKRTRNN